MITDLLINTLYIFVQGIVSLLGTLFDPVVLAPGIATAIQAFSSYASSMNVLFPMETILLIVAFDLAFEGVVFLYKLVRWGYQKVPGIT